MLVNKTYSNYGEISKFLGIHKVTVARIMKSLKEKGLIKIDKDGIIILDQEELAEFAQGNKLISY